MGLTYTDSEGNKLYGFSQQSLDANTEATKKSIFWTRLMVIVLMVVGLIAIVFLIYIFWLTNYVIDNGILNNIVRECGRCLG